MTITEFNALSSHSAIELLMSCCYCQSWAEAVAAERPFNSLSDLETACLSDWAKKTEAEYLAAFGHHAKIGDIQVLKDKFSTATKEQGQVLEANEKVITSLYDGNQAYEQQNGFIFIVCASGKSAEQMLALLTERLLNPRDVELQNAANEQAKIFQLRLKQNISSGES
jgi:2-oxo-4-hydroxy-4-carboxy-5-ureidoimidazoline decarboxylase